MIKIDSKIHNLNNLKLKILNKLYLNLFVMKMLYNLRIKDKRNYCSNVKILN